MPQTSAGALLKQLDENWRALGKHESGGILRACAMTLIAVLDEGEDIAGAGETLAALMHEQPNRTILLKVAESGAGVEGRTAIQCWMPFGRNQQICCEEIQIQAPRAWLESAARLLNGLMVADLPVVIWCKNARLAMDTAVRPLLDLAGKVIVDTSRLYRAGLAAECLEQLSGRWQLADLSWARITRWRETIAQALRMQNWDHIDSLEIAWAGAGTPPTAAYLCAWLANACGWARDALSRVTLRCVDEDMPPHGQSRIREVRLASDGRPVVLRRPPGPAMAIEVDGLKAHAVFPSLTDAVLLREELTVSGEDPQFLKAFERLKEITWP